MSSAIPRLQDLSYFEVGILTVANGGTFEQVRRSLVERARDLERDADLDGSFDEHRWERKRKDIKEHANNAVEVLKEMMIFGWLSPAPLPSSPSSAYLHVDDTYELLQPGKAWAALVTEDRRSAYNALTQALMSAHPQFKGFLRAVGALASSSSESLTIPLLRWNKERHRSEDEYLEDLLRVVGAAVQSGQIGWSADKETIAVTVRGYVERIRARRRAREKTQTTKEFLKTCEEAVTKLAFSSTGTSLDYISMELLRRWSRFLGIVNFTYYGPGSYALRLWATGHADFGAGGLAITRRIGPSIRRHLLESLPQIWQDRRPGGMYASVWELRAASCWRLKVADTEWDKAIEELLRGEHPDLPYRIHLDQASLGPVPGSTRPLVIPTTSGHRRVFNVINVIPTTKELK